MADVDVVSSIASRQPSNTILDDDDDTSLNTQRTATLKWPAPQKYANAQSVNSLLDAASMGSIDSIQTSGDYGDGHSYSVAAKNNLLPTSSKSSLTTLLPPTSPLPPVPTSHSKSDAATDTSLCPTCQLPTFDNNAMVINEQKWHAPCFHCNVCKKALVGVPCFLENGLLWCETHYDDTYGKKCAHCHQVIKEVFLNRDGRMYLY